MKRIGLILIGWLVLGGCELGLPEPEPMPGKVCYDDTDCAPNGCCGMGTDIVHVSDAPSCSGVQCSGSCPVNGIKCGCAVPVCRGSRCTSAISVTPDCE
jgi:hypothetical protein